MRIRALRTLNVRNLADDRLAFEDGVTAVVGPNAAGKSNLLVALLLGATGTLPSGTIGDALRFGTDAGFVRLELETLQAAHVVEVGLERGRKQVRLDGQGVRAADLGTIGGAVRIAPEDADLVHGSPSRRRAFLDDLLGRTSLRYAMVARAYHRVVDQRNALLKSRTDASSLAAWDARFVELGNEVQALRGRIVAALDPRARAAYDRIAGGGRLTVTVRRSQPTDDLAEALAATRDEERARGATLVGPHRDDLDLELDGRLISAFGSRGEARTAALALRVAEFELLEARHAEAPVLLVDDVHAELDPSRRDALAALTARAPQAVLTGTEAPTRFDRLWTILGGVVDRAPAAARPLAEEDRRGT